MIRIAYDGAQRMVIKMEPDGLARFLDSLLSNGHVRADTLDDLDLIPISQAAWWYGNGRLKTYNYSIAHLALKATNDNRRGT